MRQYIWLLCLLLFAQLALPAATLADGGKPAPTQTEWEQLTGNKAFTYKDEIEGAEKRQDVTGNIFNTILMAIAAFLGSGIGQVLLWTAVFLFAAWALYKIFLQGTFSLRRKKYNKPPPAEGDGEDLAATNWNVQLQHAMQANDMRMAIRYSYMLLLQMLQESGQIQYRPDKTNYEYYHELNDRYKQDFRALTRQYEYAWYGNFAIREDSYRAYLDTFNRLKKMI